MRKLYIALILAVYCISCQPVRGVLPSSVMDIPYEITDSAPLFCSEDSQNFYESKVLFVIDQTASNKKSDPDKIIRKKSIAKFMDQNKQNNVSYGMISFSNKVFSAVNLQQDDILTNIPSFTSDPEVISDSLEKMFSRKDRGGGNYSKLLMEVLHKIREAIDFDTHITRQKVVDYHIVFMSDGNLSVSESGQKSFVNGIEEITTAFERVSIHSMYYGDYDNKGPSFSTRLGQGAGAAFHLWAFFSTGFFFYPPPALNQAADPASDETDDVRRVKKISKEGKGRYVDQNENSGWALDLNQQWDTNSFIVYNLNAGFCLDGYIGMDSDMDGLCDQDEMKIDGFEPDNRFSFNDGYGDYFHWMEYTTQKELPSCSNREDRDRDLLTYCEEQYINSLESDFSPLSPENPDSDGDRILDGIEVLVYWTRDPLAARNPYNLDRESEGLSDYEKIVKHISPFAPVKKQTAYDTFLIPVKGENGSCYSLRQAKLPLYSTLPVDEDDTLSQNSQTEGENTLLVYTLRRRKDSDSSIYQFMYRTIYKNSGKLNLPIEGSSFQYLAFTNSSGN